MALTNTAARNAKPQSKPYKLFDGEGMFLHILPAGGKYWRLKYRWAGKEKLLALGVFPHVSLLDARERRAEARKLLAQHKDPGELKKDTKRRLLINAENSFEAVARDWHEAKKAKWSDRYAGFILSRLERDIFPKLGSRPIAEINAPELLTILRGIEKRGALEIAHRALNVCGQIFMFGIATCRAERNPAADLQGSLQVTVKQNYAYLKESELPEFLNKLEAYNGDEQTKLAFKLLVLTFVRTSELRSAEWKDIDFKKREWLIPAERMKMRRPHIVPLSDQAITVLKRLQHFNGQWRYVFPNQRKPINFMSENAILFALYRLGYHGRATGHGFRHTASTILNENGFNSDHIERQLAHVQGNKVRGVYNHAEYLPARRKMMQWWADHLDQLRVMAHVQVAA
jgi:integrase